MGAKSAFSLLRAFSGTKFYEAAQAGSLSGAVPFSMGALVVPHIVGGFPTQYVFGNAPGAGNSGCSIRQLTTTGQWQTQQGTTVQDSGTLAADATNDATSQVLANQFKSDVSGNLPVTTGPERVWDTLRPNMAALIVMTIDDTNQNTYVNGQLVAVTARDVTTSVNPFRMGLAPDGGSTEANAVSIAGAFYHGAALNAGQVIILQAACMDAKDIIADLRGFGGSPAGVLDYVWSVKQGNFDCRANWASVGGAATPINMVRHGTWFPTGVGNSGFSDVYSADFPWSRV